MTNKKSGLEFLLQLFFAFLMKWWGIRDPIKVLRKCIKNEEWFKGIVLSTAFLEGIGIKVLTSHFKGQIEPEKIRRLRLEQTILLLYASEMIDTPTYSKMMEVKSFRNSIVHFEAFTVPKLQRKEAKEIIEKAMICLKALIEIPQPLNEPLPELKILKEEK